MTKLREQAAITLAKTLDITAAAPLAAEFSRFRGSDLVVDASKVERVGAQCLQVLASAAATWPIDGVDLELSAPSPAFIEAIGAAGLELTQFEARNA
jgi:chemotaxis protein CheX